MQRITPFLWSDNQAEEAVNFYVSAFSNKTGPISNENSSRIGDLTQYNEEGSKVSGRAKGSVMTITFELDGQKFMALNGGPIFKFSPSISFFKYCESEKEINKLWETLSEGGIIRMKLGKYPFSEKFGWLDDKFGVSWQLNLSKGTKKITPFLWFGNQAESAINFYTSLFSNIAGSHTGKENSTIIKLSRFGPDESGPVGSVQHAVFSLDGQEFMAMDSNKDNFTPAISLFVNCETQAEIDEFWERLSEGGEKSQCGWLTDKFGVTWQIVPTALGKLMSDPDPEKYGRVMRAMLQMKKIDIEELEKAYYHG